MGKCWLFFILINVVVTGTIVYTTSNVVVKPKVEEYRSVIAKNSVVTQVEHALVDLNQLVTEVDVDGKTYNVKYTLNDELTSYVKKLLGQYRTDHSVVVVLDNSTGKILSAVGYDGKERSFDYNLVFSSTHPAASLFKIVTSAALLEGGHINIDDEFTYRGRGATLYRYQLQDKLNRWSRNISYKKAFAESNNVVVGKAAIKNLTAGEIYEMAGALGFNKNILESIDVTSSRFEMPTSQYNLAESASGFNLSTTIGPVHAALVSLVIANDGVMNKPALIESIISSDGKEVYSLQADGQRVISHDASSKVKQLMLGVVSSGTASSFKKRLNRHVREKLLVGGKTGSITGGVPFGKRDWFTAFAMPKDDFTNGNGISVCVMNINGKKWYVKSTYLAKEIIEFYYSKINPVDDESARKIAASEH